MAANKKDSAGVIIPPPLIYLGFLGLGFLLDYFLPATLLPAGARYPVAAALIVPALVPFLLAARAFHRAGTALPPHKPSTAIVTSGPYRFSRNPIYLAMSAFHAGIAVAADSAWVLGMLLPALLVLHFWVILREERYLEAKFGAEYTRYKASVRRWM